MKLKIDPRRLTAIEDAHSAAFGAYSKLGREVDNLREDERALRQQIETTLQERARTRDIQVASEMNLKLARQQQRLEALIERRREVTSMREAAGEQLRAANDLLARCRDFVGGRHAG